MPKVRSRTPPIVARVALVITASRKAARGTPTIVTDHYVRIPMPLTVTHIFRISPKNILLLLGIWGVAFINPFFKVYALIRSVAFIRVLLLFGGGGYPPFPPFDQFQ